MELYIITGFLGSGKTTFMNDLIPKFANKKVAVIVNEFGSISVDDDLINEERKNLYEIDSGSIFCVCRMNEFEKTLVKVKNSNPDLVLVETSGIADPSSLESILAYKDLEGIDYKGLICLVDGERFEKIEETVVASRNQIVSSGLIVINKSDKIEKAKLENLKDKISKMNGLAEVVETSFGKVDMQWINDLKPLDNLIFEKPDPSKINFQKLSIKLCENCDIDEFTECFRKLVDATYRLKGYALIDGEKYLLDCVGSEFKLTKLPQSTEIKAEKLNVVVAIAGCGMPLWQTTRDLKDEYMEVIDSTKFA